MGLTYKDSGVNIEAGYEVVSKISDKVRSTFNEGVLDNFGQFGALFQPNITNIKEPVLVSSTDGVGTKLLLAIELGIFDTIGIDLVAMCVNDIVTLGAKPLFMLDYIATHKIEPDKIAEIVGGIVEGCKQSECALIGGETAEMKDVYRRGDFDLAGFIVGMVDKSKIINGKTITEKDKILMLPSSGVHSNGYSLARKVAVHIHDKSEQIAFKKELLTPTKIYVKQVNQLIKNYKIKGISNITGGGLYENVARSIPKTTNAVIKTNKWKLPKVFKDLKTLGHIKEEEMFKTFNMGVGMTVIVDSKTAGQITKANPEIIEIGEIKFGEGKVVIE